MSARKIALFIDPPSYHFLADRLFAVDNRRFDGDSRLAEYITLREVMASKGIPVHTADYLPREVSPGTLNLYVSMGMLNYRRLANRSDVVLSAFFLMESPVVDPHQYFQLSRDQRRFARIFSVIDCQAFERVVGARIRSESIRWPQVFETVHEEIWRRTERKFLVMINVNKLPGLSRQQLYTERLRAIDYFARFGEMDLFGVGWDGPAFDMRVAYWPRPIQRAFRRVVTGWQRVHPDPLLAAARRVWRGTTASKADTLGQYNFSLVIENVSLDGWVTEKIFDCFYSGTVPIYLGAPNVAEYIPADCFIDMRQFSSLGELRTYISSLSERDLVKFKERAREFIGSDRFAPFSKQTFVERFVRMVEQDAGADLF